MWGGGFTPEAFSAYRVLKVVEFVDLLFGIGIRFMNGKIHGMGEKTESMGRNRAVIL